MNQMNRFYYLKRTFEKLIGTKALDFNENIIALNNQQTKKIYNNQTRLEHESIIYHLK